MQEQQQELSPEQYEEALAALADEELQQHEVDQKLLRSGALDEQLAAQQLAPVADMRPLLDTDAYQAVRVLLCHAFAPPSAFVA